MAEGTARVEAFSDGVFAIAITLLILEIRVPPAGGAGGLWAGLLALWPSYVAFLLSFFVVLVMWVNHHELMRLVRVVTYPLLFANGLLLLTVTFVPYLTGAPCGGAAAPQFMACLLERRPAMAIRIGDEAPDFTAATTEGTVHFHEWVGDKWAILFSHPKDFTPVCTTELGYMARLKPEFDKRNTRIIGLSADPVSDHQKWKGDIKETQGTAVDYPMIGDDELKVAKLYDMLPASATPGKRTPMDNATVRSVFIIGPDKKVKAMLVYPMSSGRNFDEVLRLLDSVQLNAKHTVATPVNWKPGEDVIIPTSVSDEDAKKKYPQGFKTHKPYLRTVAQPK